jgi:uncharacterized protein (TIGR02996 family)
MQRNPELERAILANPDDTRAWSVFADWLQAQGDPWGERLSLELARLDAGIARQREIQASLDALDRRHRQAMFGAELATLMDHEDFDAVVDLDWRHGFVIGIRVHPNDAGDEPRPAQVLRALLDSPVSRFLQHLTLGITDERYPTSLNSGIAVLRGHPQLETVRELFLGDFNYPEESEISWVTIGDISAVLAACPNLRSLHVCGASIELGDALIHPKLEHLKLETGGLPARAVQAVGRCWLPELRSLEVWFGRMDYGGDGSIEMLAPLMLGQGLPKLEHLALNNSEFEDDIAIALAKAPILDRLQRLGLAMGILRDRGARAILEAADRFRHLEAIDLDFNWLSAGMAERLQLALPAVHIGRRNEPRELLPDEDEDEDDEDEYGHYYTQVGE